MIRFDSDYMAGAHPEVMEALVRTNLELTAGYGNDPYTSEARELIRKATGNADAEVMFLVGGTQTNATVIDGLLARHEGVLAAESGHIAVHESGAIEASRHKVLTLPHHEGKVKAEDVECYIAEFYADETYQHMVAPGMLYISQPTEYGTIYSLEELAALSEVCHNHNIPLYVDGARLGYALAAEDADFTLEALSRLADVFYIGGTKVGTLFGEAVVVNNRSLLKNLFPLVKQHGALLAKGRLLGVQFATLFGDGLYERIGAHGVRLAMRIRKAFAKAGYEPIINSTTNQQFFQLPNTLIDSLRREASFDYWGPRGTTESTVRFVTSWSTTDEDVDRLERLLDKERRRE
ncbi:MAG: aminotransferase class I/II-fold pyridoxal phosphate-dependent enzyme [Alistipes sp.]|nr:aminotransferase class I/II-fold pyridoxal phosphate-dependent enzyme [Alistipes sp.]